MKRGREGGKEGFLRECLEGKEGEEFECKKGGD
jgi:hypothetical protein